MKKIVIVTLALTLCLIAFASCKKSHTHKNCGWIADNLGHYISCSGENERINAGEHTVDKDHICTVCGAQVVAFSPKSLEITVFNEFGFEKTRTFYYDSNIIYRTVTEFEMDGSAYKGYKIYRDKVLVEEGKFASVTSDDYILSQRTTYDADGEYSVYIYNDHGDYTKCTNYNKTGNEISVTEREHVYDKNGIRIQRKSYGNGVLYRDIIYEATPDGESRKKIDTYYYSDGDKEVVYFDENENETACTTYDANGDILEELTYKYTYDKDGSVILIKEYEGSSLTKETVYSYTTYKYAKSITYKSKETLYYDDEKDVYIYDENNDYISITQYGTNGEIVRLSEFEYIYDDLGNLASEKEFVNGNLTHEYEYSCRADDPTYTYRSKLVYYEADGYKYVTFYDESGYVTKEIYYDNDGEIDYECTHEYTFDDKDNMLSKKEYTDGKLIREYEYSYKTSNPSETFQSKRTDYYDDSTKRVEIYNENRETVSATEYDAEGNVTYSSTFEYEYDDNGELLKRYEYENGKLTDINEYAYYPDDPGRTYFNKHIIYYEDASYRIIVYNTRGSIISDTHYFADSTKHETLYDGDGNTLSETYYDVDGYISEERTYEYTFDDKGNVVLEKEYKNGKLYSQTEYSYKTDDPEDIYRSQRTYYYDDLSKEIVKYDEYGATVSSVVYDAQGNVTFSVIYENEYDSEGNFLNEKKYENGVLTCLWEYSYYTDGHSGTHVSQRTEYFNDGSILVTVYSEDDEITSETYYDKDGNVIPN